MTDVSQYKMLDEVEHVLTRSGMYLGSTSNTKTVCFIPHDGKMVEKEITYNPALLKMFDEVVSNSVDEHKRSGKVKAIWVTLSPLTGEISVADDGGIPVVKHPEYDLYVPNMIFGELRTGSNFDDNERLGAGMNGLGAKLTSIFSKTFTVDTADGKKRFTQTFRDNLSVKDDYSIVSSNNHGTNITFLPDYERLGCGLDSDNVDRIRKRVYDVAGCNPGIKVYLDNELIKVNKFKDYVGMYVEGAVEEQQPDWHIAIGANSDDTFRQVSFVNGVDTFNGGSHIDYVVNQITYRLRDFIKKKHKVDVKPNNIKQQLFVFINCSVNAPMFTSQTKEYMSSDVKDYGTEYKLSDKFFNKLVKSEVVQRVLDWAEGEQRRKELAEARKINKETQSNNYLKRIVKFDDATSTKRQDCSLLIVEGDSAAKAILSARDSKKHGVYPLKGKPLNVRDIKISKLTANQEFADLMAIIGLKLGQEAKPEDLRFGRIIVATDADIDGYHINGLIMNMFQAFWPNLLEQGVIHRLKTPQVVATQGKKEFEFFNRESYDKWAETSGKHRFKHYKGLGSWSSKAFAKFLQNEDDYIESFEVTGREDFDSLDLVFDKKRSNDRKEWLAS